MKNIFCGNELPSPIFPLFDITTHKKERKKNIYMILRVSSQRDGAGGWNRISGGLSLKIFEYKAKDHKRGFTWCPGSAPP